METLEHLAQEADVAIRRRNGGIIVMLPARTTWTAERFNALMQRIAPLAQEMQVTCELSSGTILCGEPQ